MNIRLLLIACILFLSASSLRAQNERLAEEMRFVEKLRAEGLPQLAMDYLKRISKKPSPALAKILPLERARTRLALANEEPDSGKRLSLYDEVLVEFQNFVKNNPKHPQLSQAKLDIAHVTSLKGKTQLSRALIQTSKEKRGKQMLQARETLKKAGSLLRSAADKLKARWEAMPPEPMTPAAQLAYRRAESEYLKAELAVALNILDEVETYDTDKLKELELRSNRLKEAIDALQKLASGDTSRAITWNARAWLGHCHTLNGDPKQGRKRLYEIRQMRRTRATDEAQRLARYFWLYAFSETTDPDERKVLAQTLVEETRAWIRDYPRHLNTPQGLGIQFMLANTLVRLADASDGRSKENFLERARYYLRRIEQTENKYTDRARQKKIEIIRKQGGFEKKVAELKSFEDCYVRAQYEIMMLGQDADKIKDEEELEKKRKERMDTILESLQRALKQPDAKPPQASQMELNTARSMLAFYSLSMGDYEQAITSGEGFARADPRSGQAALSSIYALEAYQKRVLELMKKAGESMDRKEREAKIEQAKQKQADMIKFAEYMEDRWGKELAGNLARHRIALHLMSRGKNLEAIEKLKQIQPSFPSYVFALGQLADAALAVAKDPPEGRDAKEFRALGMKALQDIPEDALGADPSANHVIIASKARLGRMLFAEKKYTEMETLAKRLRNKLSSIKLHAEAPKDQQLKKAFQKQLTDIQLFATYGLAKAAFEANDHKEVVNRIDPIVEQVNADKIPSLKDNLPLANALLVMCLRSNVMLQQRKAIQNTLTALRTVSPDADQGSLGMLQQVVVLIRKQVEDLKKKKDKAKLKTTVTVFSAVLDDLIKDKNTKTTPKFHLYLAHAYSGMDKHDRAADVLEKAPPLELPPTKVLEQMKIKKQFKEEDIVGLPTKTNPKLDFLDQQDIQTQKAIRLLLLKELRLTGDKENLAKASKLLKAILGDGRKGWGGRDLSVRREEVQLERELGNYGKGATLAHDACKKLIRHAQTNNTYRKLYLEFYYDYVYCYFKFGQNHSDPRRRDQAIHKAASSIVELEKNWKGFGSEESKQRFMALFAQEKELKQQYDLLKQKS